jgi:hypothetical protein
VFLLLTARSFVRGPGVEESIVGSFPSMGRRISPASTIGADALLRTFDFTPAPKAQQVAAT